MPRMNRLISVDTSLTRLIHFHNVNVSCYSMDAHHCTLHLFYCINSSVYQDFVVIYLLYRLFDQIKWLLMLTTTGNLVHLILSISEMICLLSSPYFFYSSKIFCEISGRINNLESLCIICQDFVVNYLLIPVFQQIK